MKNKILFLFLFISFLLRAEVFYVSPSGSNNNDGKTPETAWKTIDRGQPTYLRKETKEGDKVIYVARAVQFPEKGSVKIGDKVVKYNGRTADSLLNCEGTPEARKGTKVISLDWDYVKPGDKIIVLDGVYVLKEKFSPENKEWAGGNDGVFAITVSGKKENPIIIEGKGQAIVDGEWGKRSIFIRGNNIIVKNLNIRRGGILVVFSDNVEITGCRIYYGIHSLFVRYSKNININNNLIYDFHGAWTDSGIEVGDTNGVNIFENTIVNCSRGLRIWGGTKNVKIERNLIAWNGVGIMKDEKAEIKKKDIKDNLLWANGRVTWLHNLGKEGKKEGINHYKGIDFVPEDILNQDPKIVSWYSDSKNFLSPHKSSVCFSKEKKIGAKTPADYEKRYDYKEGENILFNGSFEFGFYGWRGKSWWPFNTGEAKWEIKNGGVHGEKCLFIEESPKGKGRSAPSVTSFYFPINKGKQYTISFYAKGKGRLGVGFAVVSWHDGSSFGKKINLTDEWKKYSIKINLPDYVADWVAVKFSADWSSAYIDKVCVYEGEVEKENYPDVEIFYKTSENGLLNPNGILPLIIKNYTNKENLKAKWEIISPYNEKLDEGLIKIDSKEKNLKVKIKEGIYLFKYSIIDDNNVICRGQFRFATGKPVGKIKNRNFIAATPPYKLYPKIEDYENMVKKLSSYGIGTFHIYAGAERIKECTKEDYFEKLVSIARKYNIDYLITPDDSALFTGKRAFVPEPGDSEIPEIKKGEGRLTEGQLKLWKKYVSEFVKKFKGRVKYYEICNEPNCYLTGDEYVKLFKETAPLIKSIDPSAQIIAGSVVNAFRKDLYNKTLKLPASSFDWFSFHPYRFGIKNPEIQGPFREHLRMVKEDMRKNGHKEKIWLTEEGMGPLYERGRCLGLLFSYSHALYTDYFSIDEIIWTDFAMRMYLTAFGEGCGGYNYHTLPVMFVDSEITPALLLKTLHTMANLLGNTEPEGFMEIDDFIVYIFSEKNKKIAVIWNKDSEYGRKTKVEINYKGRLEIKGLFGENIKFSRKKGKTSFPLDRHVCYLIFERVDTETLKRILKNAFK